MSKRTIPLILGVSTFAPLAFGLTLEERFKSMDTDGDARISAAEHAAAAKVAFDNMDANHDGTVTVEEMERGKSLNRSEPSSAEKIRSSDTNGDGSLSFDEHVAGSHSLFEKMDINHDGFLSSSEFLSAHSRSMRKTAR